ncbi:Wadjet anti-phage system protein JetD domain-containing protein [Chryseobacterium sp. S-02]|uniref:Wadjet anti-phage system protein JetD domain-containing protein n=1 Tax=Chryseobacterium sp. S-02 TaxID=3404064 RepID=UPI003CFAE4E5
MQRYWEHPEYSLDDPLRSYHPHTQSVMMDRTTFETFQNYAVSGARNKSQNLNLLSKEENDLFQYLKALEKNRLEQEKIPQMYVDRCLKNRIES